MAQSFAYLMPSANDKWEYEDILQYNYMPSESIFSTLYDTPLYTANIFKLTEDCVLQYVSTMTGDLNTLSTVSVYLLSEDAQCPTDGVLLQSVTQECPYAGYHRISLPQNLALDSGARIGVVVLNRVPTDDGVKYALVNTAALSRQGTLDYNAIKGEDKAALSSYAVGKVNPGESFVCFEGDSWLDWADVVERLNGDEACARRAYDNLPIKGYSYPLDQIIESHRFDTWAKTAGDGAAICTDCGYLLLFASPHTEG